MKKTITILLVCVSAVFLFWFLWPEKNNKKAPENEMEMSVLPANAIPLDTAISNISRYVNSCKKYFPGDASDSIIRAYTVSATDMYGVLRLNPEDTLQYDQCRVYLGLDYRMRFKLYLTPAESDSDIILFSVNSKKDTVRYVYDLNAPCPSTCAVNSPLNVR